MEDKTNARTDLQNCRCLELKERVSKSEDRFIELETELQKRNKETESLELKFKELESEKLKVEEELRNLLESEKDSLFEQMMVNKALEVEKEAVVKESECWKSKFEKLVEAVRKLEEIGAFRDGEFEFDENVKIGLELASIEFPKRSLGTEKIESFKVNHQTSGSLYITTPVKDCISERSRGSVSSSRRVNKMLSFEGDGRKSADVVDLCENETEERSGKDTVEERSVSEKYEDDDVEACEDTTSTSPLGRKRKRVVTSDSENDDDDEDNIPIALLKKLEPTNQESSGLVDTPSTGQRRVSSRLRKQRVTEESERYPSERPVGVSTTGNGEDDETEKEEEEGSERESESLDGFIVDDDDGIENVSETGEEESDDGETGYADVMSRLRRDKNGGKRKWEYEADMLADFGKDPELCMRAVCVLYRFQTEDEKATRSSHVNNGRGFSKFDAKTGTRIARYLTDGDPSCDLKKSAEELKSYMPKDVETCGELARRYSKQLFAIYKEREDPFFAAPPSP